MHLLFATTVVSFLTSMLTAQLVDAALTDRIAIIDSFVGLQRSHNPGIAFGVHLGSYQEIIIIIALILVTIIAIRAANTRIESIGFGCIIGGGLANVIDRYMDGWVTDMIQVGTFPIFNIADVFINVGVGILIFCTLFLRKKRRENSLDPQQVASQ